ncbi:MAG: hypothetical protein ACM3VT_06305 [Solirubrobacterales bacterium]
MRREEAERLGLALTELPYEQREVLLLHLQADLTDRTSERMNRRILADLSASLTKKATVRAAERPAARWRTNMSSGRIKFAVAAVAAVVVMLPVSYGAVKVIQRLFVVEDKVTFEYSEPNNGATKYTFARVLRRVDGEGREITQARVEESLQLYAEGKAQQVEPDVWQARLASGELFTYKGNPETDQGAAFSEEEKTQLKQMTDEINELQKAGKGERVFWKEIEENGLRIRLYNVTYTLANGKEVTLCEGREVK